MLSTTLASMKQRKVCVFSSVRFTVTSLISGEAILHSSVLQMHFNLSSVVYYGNTWLKCDWKVVSQEYKRPAVGQGCYVSFPVPDGQNLASSYWALCYDWLNACPCVERVSECIYSRYVRGEMKRLHTEGKRMRMGSLNAIVFSCGTVTIYLTGVDVQRRLAVPTESKLSPFLVPTFLHMSLANWNIGIKWMENHSNQTQIQFCFQICRVKWVSALVKGLGNGARMQALWGRNQSQQTSASWQTHNKHLRQKWFSGWKEQTWKWTN